MKDGTLCSGSLLIPVLILLSLGGCRETERGADSGRQVIMASIESMGGLEEMTGWSTRSQYGVMEAEWPGWGHLTATTVRHVEKPDMAYIDNDFSAYDHPFYFTYYLDGEEAWQVVNLGVRQSEDLTDRMKEYIRKADGLAYYADLCDTFIVLASPSGDSLLPEKNIVRIEGRAGADTLLFDIDRETGFLLRTVDVKDARRTLYEDYRQCGELMLPYHETVYKEGVKTEEFTWKSIVFDEPIDRAIFEENRP